MLLPAAPTFMDDEPPRVDGCEFAGTEEAPVLPRPCTLWTRSDFYVFCFVRVP